MKYLLDFSKTFPGEPTLTLHEYLGKASKEDVLLAGAFLLGVKTHNSQLQNTQTLLSKWFCTENNQFANEVYQQILVIQKEMGLPILIVNPISSLQLFEFAFSELEENGEMPSTEFEVNLFKAYLTLNEANTQLEYVTKKSIEKVVDKDLKWAAFNMTARFSQFEFMNYYLGEILTAQLIKAVYLFEFISDNEKCSPVLRGFLDYYDCSDWQYYLKSYLPLTHSLLKRDTEAHLNINVESGDKFDEGCAFLDKLILQDKEQLDEFDFRTLRAVPLYKLEKGKYRIIFDLFVAEKVFTGLYFKLREVYDSLPGEQKALGNFRSFYTTHFSENYLLYKTLQSCFPKKYVHLPGEKLKESGMAGEPDYYIRNKNKIFLFENKDVLIGAEVKQSSDFNQLEPELRKRLYYEEKKRKRKNCAVLQLITNIKNILTGSFDADKGVKTEHVKIFPILVLHYNQFNTPGLNKFINSWFQDELENLNDDGLDVSKVRSLTIIDIDTFITLQDYLMSRQIQLETIIDWYWIKNRNKIYINPFSNYILNHAIKRKLIKPPKILNESGLKLFENKQ